MGSFSRRMRRKSVMSFKHDARKTTLLEVKTRFDIALADHKQHRYDNQTRGSVADYLVLAWAYMLNRDYHYGTARLTRLFKHVIEFLDEIHMKWSLLPEWEKALREEAGFNVKHLGEKPFTHDERITMRELERQNIVYSCALFVEYNFHGKRLKKCVDGISSIIRQIQYGENTFEKLEDILAKKKIDMTKIFEDAKETWQNEKKKLQSRHQAESLHRIA